MYRQLRVLDQARLDVVSASKDPEQAGIGWCLVIGILDQHSHFATDALQAHRHRQSQKIIRCTRRRSMLRLQITQRCDNAVQTAFVKGIETYLDIIAAQMGGDEQEARQQAIALFSGLVGAMMLSRAVKKSDPTLSDELLSSARKILKLKN